MPTFYKHCQGKTKFIKVTAQTYGQFLVNTILNVTGIYFADTADGLAQYRVSDFLKHSKLTHRIIRDKALNEMPLSPHGFILFDDTVMNKDWAAPEQTITQLNMFGIRPGKLLPISSMRHLNKPKRPLQASLVHGHLTTSFRRFCFAGGL